MRLDHIQLAMPPGSEEQARAFYSTLLGLEEETKPERLRARGGCWFRRAGLIVHLGVESEFRPQRKAHPAFLVEDLEAIARSLEAAGHRVEWDTVLPDRSRFFSADPFGNRIELLRDGDGFSQR